jgi:hypothetical protein
MLISVTLVVSGDLLDPEEITALLNVTPHVSRRKGDVRTYPSQKEIVSKFGLWEWRSKDSSEVLTINDHVRRLKSTFEHAYELLSGLPNAENAWIDVHIVAGDEDESVSSVMFLMDTETISTLLNIGLPVEFTLDVLPPKEQTDGNQQSK